MCAVGKWQSRCCVPRVVGQHYVIASLGQDGTCARRVPSKKWHKVAAFARHLCHFARVRIATYAFSVPGGRIPVGPATRVERESREYPHRRRLHRFVLVRRLHGMGVTFEDCTGLTFEDCT